MKFVYKVQKHCLHRERIQSSMVNIVTGVRTPYKTSFTNFLIKMVSSETIFFFNTETQKNEPNGHFVQIMSSYTVHSLYFRAKNELKSFQMRPFITVSKKWCK